MKHFMKALLEVTEQASADTVETLKRLLAQGDAAAAYTQMTVEAHALSVALEPASASKRFAGRSSRSGPRPRDKTTVELNGMKLSQSQAQRRLNILRTMQRAAFEDTIDDERKKRKDTSAESFLDAPVPGAGEPTSPKDPGWKELRVPPLEGIQQAFPWSNERSKP